MKNSTLLVFTGITTAVVGYLLWKRKSASSVLVAGSDCGCAEEGSTVGEVGASWEWAWKYSPCGAPPKHKFKPHTNPLVPKEPTKAFRKWEQCTLLKHPGWLKHFQTSYKKHHDAHKAAEYANSKS